MEAAAAVLINKRMQLGIWTRCAGFHTNLSTLKAKGNTNPYSGPNSKKVKKVD